MDLKDKVVLITGASSGIGAETARLFASKGATLSLADVNKDWLNDVVAKCTELSPTKGKILQTVGDLTDAAVREKFVDDSLKEFGKIDILLNIAGIAKKDSLLSPDLESFDKVVAINLKAPYHLSSLCAPHLIKTKGSIINISSTASTSSFPGGLTYCLSKAGLDSLTENSALELGPHGVRVNSVNPGFTYTNIGTPQPGQKMPRQILDGYLPYHLLGRLAEPSEIADAIAFVAESKNMTGSHLLIDGGFHISRQQPPAKS